jgi:bifunctional DNA-binding transcriptional regulator/antitoxin component of YhaV-PrlF toxin-antitoxin module
MANVTDFTDPLSGYDPIEDVVGQIRKYLRMDCSLRREDGYSGGFKGRIKIELDCYAVRAVHIEVEVPITIPPKIQEALDVLPPDQLDKFEINETIEIPLEPNLNAVRQRIKDNQPENLESEAPAPEDEENLVAPRTKRQYRKRTAALTEAVPEPVF